MRLRTCDVCRKSVEEKNVALAPEIDVVGVFGLGGSYGLSDMCRDCYYAFKSAAETWIKDRKSLAA